MMPLTQMTRLFAFLALASALAAGDSAFPRRGTEQRIQGRLVHADFIHRSGQFRTADGTLMDFKMPPCGLMHCKGSEADMREVPLGTQMTFLLLPDADGKPTVLVRTEDGLPPDEAQKTRFIEFTKARGIAASLDKTEANLVTLTFFSGAPETFKATWMKDIAPGKTGGKLCVANDELRTWNPPVDGEAFTVMEVRDVPAEGLFGSSGVQLVVKVTNMLEGFRKGRVVRVFLPGWKAQDQYYGESLMGYGFGRMLNQELVENPAKEYPEQFPFRTEFGNRDLSWYQLKPGVKPPPFSEHLVLGELVKADAATRTGQFKKDRTGELVDFTLIPEGNVKYLNADASLSDLPLGMRCRFHLYEDEKGAFTRASLVSDEFSHQASNAVTWRADAPPAADGTLQTAWQLPLVKDYNGDMQRPQDIARSLLPVSSETRVWKDGKQLTLQDIAAGDALLANLTSEQPGKPARALDIWIGEDTHKQVTEAQKKKSKPVAKR